MPRNGVRSSRRNKRSRRVRSKMHNKAEHRADYRGIICRGNPDPNRVLIAPWNKIVVSALVVGTPSTSNNCITLTNIHTWLSSRLGITASITYRFIRIAFWHIIPNGELNNRVTATIYPLDVSASTCGAATSLAVLDDYGTPARPATLKFIWPRVHQSIVLTSFNNGPTVLARLTLGPSQQVLTHVEILWKTTGAPPGIWRPNSQTGEYELVQDEVNSLLHSQLYTKADCNSLSDSFAELDVRENEAQ
jgi:hypothetical protein